MKSSHTSPPGGTRIKSGHDGRVEENAVYNLCLDSVIPGLDPGISFHELSGWYLDFSMKSSYRPPPGGTRIKSGHDGRVEENAAYNVCLDSVIPGLDPGISFQ